MTRKEFMQRQVSTATETYREPRERAALRCALGDAAHLCDLIRREIEANNPGRKRGSVSSIGQAMAANVEDAASMIWQMREMIEVPR